MKLCHLAPVHALYIHSVHKFSLFCLDWSEGENELKEDLLITSLMNVPLSDAKVTQDVYRKYDHVRLGLA